MRIGVLTYHRSYSYGACLQAYATVAFLNEKGYTAELIDYTNAYEQRFRKLFFTENGKLSGYVSSIIKDVLLRKRHYSKLAFDRPNNDYPISSTKYKSHEDLKKVNYDVLIVGSDQMWNRNISNGLDEAYLLRYGKAKRRISVATSMGSVKLTEEEKMKFKIAFENFTAISTREDYAKEQLQPLTEKPIKVLMDPTFLFSGADWVQRLALKSKTYAVKNDKYILTFFLAADNSYKEKVAGYAKLFGLPVWSIQSTRVKRVDSDRVILGATIEDFVALLMNAELVITDSFHGVALSINLKKNFISIRNAGNPKRVISLLASLRISERLDMKPEDYKPVDYEILDRILEPLRKDSQDWIIDAVEGNSNG
jgi:hypothetical protein